MATVHSISGPPSGGTPPRGPTYQVTTRELSPNFDEVGPDHEARELGPVDATTFRKLLEQLCAIDPMKLVDADPQLLVTVKSGRFLIQPQGGKLLVRPANALDQMFFKLSPAEIPSFLDDSAPPPPKNFTTLIGSAAQRAEAEAKPASAPAEVPAASRRPNRRLLFGGIGVIVIAAGVGAWLYLGAKAVPPPPPAAVVKAAPQFDPITAPAVLASLLQRFTGTYATSGDAGERLLELRADGTFNYQEFGSSLAITKHETGAFSFMLRHGTQTSVIRAGSLGAIELRDENSLAVRDVVFQRLALPAK